MTQIKIYGLRSFIESEKQAISDAIHESAVEGFGLPADKRFHRFFALDKSDFIYPEGRSDRYLIVEVSMFEGRSREAKALFCSGLATRLQERCGLTEADLEVTMTESPRENWWIRDKMADELELNYRVET